MKVNERINVGGSEPQLPTVTNIISWARSLYQRLAKHYKPTTSSVVNVAASAYNGSAYRSLSLCLGHSDSFKTTE